MLSINEICNPFMDPNQLYCFSGFFFFVLIWPEPKSLTLSRTHTQFSFKIISRNKMLLISIYLTIYAHLTHSSIAICQFHLNKITQTFTKLHKFDKINRYTRKQFHQRTVMFIIGWLCAMDEIAMLWPTFDVSFNMAVSASYFFSFIVF